MHYQYSYVIEDGVEAIATGLQALFGLFGTAWNLAAFVLTAISLYAIAKRRGIHNPWLAWVPVVNVWLLGSLSDQYRYVVKGEYKSKRKTLLVLQIVKSVISIALFVVLAVVIGMTMAGLIGSMSEARLMREIGGWLIGMLVLLVPTACVTIAYLIVYFMALNDLYRSCDPNNSTMYLVLSIFFGFTMPFFLFFNRSKDEGMPPRRTVEPEPQVYEQPAWEPEQTQNYWKPEESSEAYHSEAEIIETENNEEA